MRSPAWLTFALLTAASSAFSAERNFDPVPSDGYKIQYEEGTGIAVAIGDFAIAAISCSPSDSKGAWVGITVKNISGQSYVVRETSLAVSSNRQQLRVATFEDLVKRQKRQEFWDQIGANASAYTNSQKAAAAGTSTTSGWYSETTSARAHGSGGYASGTAETVGSYSSTTHDGGAADAARARADEQNARMFERVRQTHAEQRGALERRALRAETVDPGEYVDGSVFVYLPKKSKRLPALLELTLSVGTDRFVFLFQERT